MHRLLVDRALLDADAPLLPKEAARHLKVLRPGPGEALELFDGHGFSRDYAVVGAASPSCLSATSPLAFHPNPFAARPITLFACITKGSRWDWTIEKATELGVSRIVPVLSERTIVRIPAAERAAKRERWLRIAEDAVRQCHAYWLPEITEAVDFPDVLPLVSLTDCYVGALPPPSATRGASQTLAGRPAPYVSAAPSPPTPSLADALRARTSSLPPSVFVGPEGDFTPDELAALLQRGHATSFGPTVLRAETAAIYALSVVAAFAYRTISMNP